MNNVREIVREILREETFVDDIDEKTRLSVFDFDGTLVKTPEPESGKKIWKEKTKKDWDGSWWTNKNSLDTDIFDIKVNPEVVSAQKREVSKKENLVVMMTGRLKSLSSEVEKILDMNGLKFDDYLYNDGGETSDDKIKKMELALKYNPNIREIVMWEDRDPHIPIFKEWGKKMIDKGYLDDFKLNYVEGWDLINETYSGVEKCSIKLTKEIVDYISEYATDENLLRKGGIPVEMLDRAAFGFSEDDIKTLMPEKLKIRWNDDLENVKFEIEKQGFDDEIWAHYINLTEPIEVEYWKDEENGFEEGFYVADGHHRYYAAKILGVPLNVKLEIKVNPLKKLAPKLGYDDFHRCIFKLAKESLGYEEVSRAFLRQFINNLTNRDAKKFVKGWIEKEGESDGETKVWLSKKEFFILNGIRRDGKIPKTYINEIVRNVVREVLIESDDRYSIFPYNSEYNDDLDDIGIDNVYDDAMEIAKYGGITILSDKELYVVLVDKGFKRLIGALWVSNNSDKFSFDVAIDSSYQGMGLSDKLIREAIDEYKYQREEYGEDLKMEVDVINPKLASILEKKYKFHKVADLSQNRVLMSIDDSLLENKNNKSNCDNYDFNSLERFVEFDKPLYSIIEKRKTAKLIYMSPKQYIYRIAIGFGGLSYEDVADSSFVNKERVKKYANNMKSGDKFPIPYYTRNGNYQEGRHRALASMLLDCDKIPIVEFREISNKEFLKTVNKLKNLGFDEIDSLFKNNGFEKGISNLGYNNLKRYIEYNSDKLNEDIELKNVSDDDEYWDRVKIIARNKKGEEVGFAILDMVITPESEFAFMDDEHKYSDDEIEKHFPEDFAAKLEHIEVYPEYRKKGFGKELMDSVIKYVKKRDYKTLYLISSPIGFEPKISLDDLSKFYSGYGFKVIKDFDNAHDMVVQLRERDSKEAKGDEIITNKFVYHKSSNSLRDSILKNGLEVRVGDCYLTYMSDNKGITNCIPAVFASNTKNPKELFDTTWDDDIWKIDTSKIGNKWYEDANFSDFKNKYPHIVTFDDIPPNALNLIYKGTGKDYDDMSDEEYGRMNDFEKHKLNESTTLYHGTNNIDFDGFDMSINDVFNMIDYHDSYRDLYPGYSDNENEYEDDYYYKSKKKLLMTL